MAISIDYSTFVITVPRADLTLVQSSPTEIREMNLNWFRLQLKDIEDTPTGMNYQDTHKHNTEVLLGGLTYARVIEILEPYTITFEDGQYAVNLIGANSNAGDRVNVNQVSVRSSNSAGMTSSPTIEHLSFNERVTIDPTHGMEGTTFPAGNAQYPVKYNQDGYDISVYRRIKKLHFIHSNTITAPLDLDGYTLSGDGPVLSALHIDSLANVQGCFITGLKVSGVLDGGTAIRDSMINGIEYFNGSIRDCIIGVLPIILGGSETAILNDCKSMVPGGNARPQIDFNDEPTSLAIRGWEGGLELVNKTHVDGDVSVDIGSGTLYIRSSCTAGEITVRGLGHLVDESGSGCVVKSTGLLDPAYVQFMTFANNSVWVDEVNGGTGTLFPMGNRDNPVDNYTDALTIASTWGLHTISIIGNGVITGGLDFTGLTIYGQNAMNTRLTVDSDAILDMVEIQECTLTGTLDGNSIVRNAVIDGINYFNGIIYNCGITSADIVLGGTSPAVFLECYSMVIAGSPTTIRFSSDLTPLLIRGMKATVTIADMADGQTISAGFASGGMVVDSSCVGGTINIGGSYNKFVDNSGVGCIVSPLTQYDDRIDYIEMMLATRALVTDIVSSVWVENLHGYVEDDTAGKLVHDVNYLDSWVYIDTELVDNGHGTLDKPFNNVEDAVDFAELYGRKQLRLLSDATVERKLKNFVIEGIGGLPVVDFNGQDVDKSEFTKVKLAGKQVGSIICREAILLDGLSGVNGVYKECGVAGDISLADGAKCSIVSSSSLLITVAVPHSIDTGVGFTDVTLNLRKYSGSVTIKNMDHASKLVSCQSEGGKFILDETNTVGTVKVSGLPTTAVVNTSGITIDEASLFPSADDNQAATWGTDDAKKLVEELLGHAIVSSDDLHVTIRNRSDDSVSHEFDISADKRTRTPV